MSAHPGSRPSDSRRGRGNRRYRWISPVVTSFGLMLCAGPPGLALSGRSAVPSSNPTVPLPTVVAGGTASNPKPGGLVTIESDQQQADNVTGVVTAIGNVRITYPERGMVATARQAQYYTREGRLVLSGDVDIIDRDGQRLRADQIVYWLNGQRLLALPAKGQQVQTRLRFDVKPAALSPRPPLP